MEARELFVRLREYYLRRDGMVAGYSIPMASSDEPIAGLIIVGDKSGQYLYYDKSRWIPRPGTRRVGNDFVIPGIAYLAADQRYPDYRDGYPFYRQHVVCANCNHEMPECPAAGFHSSMWIRLDGE